LTRAQWQVLAYVARSEGMSQVTLARLLNIKPATLVYLIDRLEAAGLIERRVDPRDRRQRNLFMTRRAWSELARMGRLTTEVWEQALAGMDEAERKHLVAMLAVVKANLQAAASTLTLSDDSV
jgi:DNA-binding MarR family transcriptional regulator